MDFQPHLSGVLAAATVVLMVVSVAIPVSVLVAQAAGEHLKRRILSRKGVFPGVAILLRRFRLLGRATPPRIEPSPAKQRRRAQKRLPTCLMGSLHIAEDTQVDNLCDVVDFSAGGARVRLVDPMAEISRITLGLRHFGFFPARVVWRNGEELGLKFDLTPETVVSQMRGLLPQPATAGAY